MVCKTYSPIRALRPYIKSYILIEDNSQLMKGNWMTIFPSGHLEMILSYGDDVHFSNGYYLRSGHGYLSGQILEPIYYRCSGSLKIISIIFKPWGLYPFLNIPQDRLISSPIDLELLLKSNNNLTQRIADEEKHEKKAATLNEYFYSLLTKMDRHLNPVSSSAGMILNSGGNMSIDGLCKHFNLNIKTIERNFKNVVGITPKAFSNIIRFNGAFEDIKSGKFGDIHDVIYRHGYYDQSHFIHEFKKYTGLSPSTFFEKGEKVSHSLREIVSI